MMKIKISHLTSLESNPATFHKCLFHQTLSNLQYSHYKYINQQIAKAKRVSAMIKTIKVQPLNKEKFILYLFIETFLSSASSASDSLSERERFS